MLMPTPPRRTAQAVADPEFFYQQVKQPIVIFDESHQLPDPTRLLKISADVDADLQAGTMTGDVEARDPVPDS